MHSSFSAQTSLIVLLRMRHCGKQSLEPYWPEKCATEKTFSSAKGTVKVTKTAENQNGPILQQTLIIRPKNSSEVGLLFALTLEKKMKTSWSTDVFPLIVIAEHLAMASLASPIDLFFTFKG